MNKKDVVNAIISSRLPDPGPTGRGKAPANIALCKYWGKRDTEINLPVTPSLSISLGHLGTTTDIELTSGDDEYLLNGLSVPADTPFAARLKSYLDLFRPPTNPGFRVVTCNTIPTAAGLASSASGYAALVKALNELYDLKLSDQELSILARIGSGSASRSISHGFVEWQKGGREDGMDSYALPVEGEWPELVIGLVKITTEEKKISSRDAMKRTVDNSVLYQSWPEQVSRDLTLLHDAIAAQDFDVLGKTAENNALTMHATGLGAWPPVLFWWPESVKTMQKVWQLRADGLPVYFTMDAGPNVKLIAEQESMEAIQKEFPDIEWALPFDKTRQL